MTRMLGIGALGLCAAASAWAVPPITAKNWQLHPRIIEVRKIYDEVNAALKAHRLREKRREFDCSKLPEAELAHQQDYYEGGVRVLAQAHDGTPRFFYREGGSEDSMVRVEYYYDAAGKLRFIFVRGGAVNGTHMETRVYYSAGGDRLWQDDGVIKGPGYYFSAPAAIDDPVAVFDAPDRCPDRAPTREK